MLLSVVTLNYKKPQLTISCMKSLYEQLGKEFEKGEIELLIVDNASGDDSVQVLQKEIKPYKHVSLIISRENGGFGKGCNLGAAGAKGKFILFLNNDTLVKDKGILEMAEYIEGHPEAAILGGQLSNPDGTPQPSAGNFYTPLNVSLLLLGLQRYGVVDKNPKQIAQVDWVKGGLFMIQSEVFKKLKGFDENIFMYTEDMELCYRAKFAGYNTYFYPQVTVYHADQGSSNRSFAIVNIYKNLLYFYKKHRSQKEYFFVKSLLQTKAAVLIGIGKVTGNKYLVETYRQAIRF
jgi:GT2 family glycosyltransferase